MHLVNKTRVLRPLMMAACAAAALLAGCANPAFRGTTAAFGALTKSSATALNERLASVSAAEEEQVRARLAIQRIELRLMPGCATAISPGERDEPGGSSFPGEPGNRDAAPQDALACRVGVFDPQQRRVSAIPAVARYENIRSLSTALANYGDSLKVLASDTTAAQTGFASAVTGVATSIGGLDAAIRTATGQSAATTASDMGSIASLVGRFGNLYLGHRRDRVLRNVIIEADPFVQRAIGLLHEAQQAAELYELVPRFTQLREAQQEAARLANTPGAPVSQLRATQDRLFELVATYNNHVVPARNFTAIGAAHRQLAIAARAGATRAELRAVLEAILDLASTAHQTITTLRTNDGSSGNDN